MAEQLYATLKTNQGDIEIRLLPNHAPKTVKNFVELAQGEREWTHPATGKKTTDRLYDGTVFHRVISGFMIQGGDPLGNGTGGPGYEFEDEFHPDLAFDKPYLLAMANAGPGTNGSQFFITVSPTAWLTRKHTIFGEVTSEAGEEDRGRHRRHPDQPAHRPSGAGRGDRVGRHRDTLTAHRLSGSPVRGTFPPCPSVVVTYRTGGAVRCVPSAVTRTEGTDGPPARRPWRPGPARRQ